MNWSKIRWNICTIFLMHFLLKICHFHFANKNLLQNVSVKKMSENFEFWQVSQAPTRTFTMYLLDKVRRWLLRRQCLLLQTVSSHLSKVFDSRCRMPEKEWPFNPSTPSFPPPLPEFEKSGGLSEKWIVDQNSLLLVGLCPDGKVLLQSILLLSQSNCFWNLC